MCAAVDITGTTRLFGVLGDPVAQVRAPTLLNAVFAELGTDAVLVPLHVSPGDLLDAARGLQRLRNLDGLLVTVPHKFAAGALATRFGDAVRITGSTNALRREADGSWRAENFDGAGFVLGLAAAGRPVAGRHVSLVGAGGAGSAIAAAVLDAGCARLSVYDHDRSRTEDLVGRLTGHWPDRAVAVTGPALSDADIVVNATPLGLTPGDPLPFPPERVPTGCLVADIIMKPRETALLTRAARAGRAVHHGHHMLDHQVPLYRSFFGLDHAARRV
ncbi:MAG: shikimate dehydrogenase [Actinocatenispora sp.]